MSIDKAYLKSEVARRTERSLADVTDAEISAAVQQITMRIAALVAECTTDTVAGQASYELASFPKKFKRVESVRIENGQNNSPLVEIKSFDDYQNMVANETQNGTPDQYIIWGDYLYLYPTPDAVYTCRLFAQVFERSADVIELNDSFTECLIQLTAYNVFASKGQSADAEAQGFAMNGEKWLQMLETLERNKIKPDNVQYNDM